MRAESAPDRAAETGFAYGTPHPQISQGKIVRSPGDALPGLARQNLEEVWRSRLEMARESYEKARAQYRALLQKQSEGAIPRQDGPLAEARQAESEALAEYARVLKVFTELTINGHNPGEGLTAPGEEPGWAAGNLISIVDDDESIRDSTSTLLRSVGYAVATFPSSESFLESGFLPETSCLILDIRMPGMSGLELQRRVNLSGAGVPIIFVTAHDNQRNRELAMEGGASELFQKPFSASAFLAAVQSALEGSAPRSSHQGRTY